MHCHIYVTFKFKLNENFTKLTVTFRLGLTLNSSWHHIGPINIILNKQVTYYAIMQWLCHCDSAYNNVCILIITDILSIFSDMEHHIIKKGIIFTNTYFKYFSYGIV